MVATFDIVTIDGPEPDRLATFWGSVLGLIEVEREDGDRWIVLEDRSGIRRIGIQRGSSRPGSIHLDIACSPAEFDAEVARVVGLGATALDVRVEPYGRIANLLDPDGNPFDLCAYR